MPPFTTPDMRSRARELAIDLAMTLVSDERIGDEERGAMVDYLTGASERPPRACYRWDAWEAAVLNACQILFRATREVTS